MSKSANTDRKEYKRELALRGKINCAHCPYHRMENAGRKPRSDKGKNHRREGRKGGPMPEKWTMKRYRSYCKGTAADMNSEHPDQVHDASIWYDVAKGVLATEPDLKAWLLANRFRGVRPETLFAALADDLASAGNF